MGSFLSRASVMVLGYAYPAYESYKSVEMNKPEIEQLRFWCQYWILVAVITVFERVGDALISWLPMYGVLKLAVFVYLWHPKTKGTTYIYNTFFKPYLSKHENEIDSNLLELRTRAADLAVFYCQKALNNGRSWFFENLQYVVLRSSTTRVYPVEEPKQAQHAAIASPHDVEQAEITEQPQQLKAEQTNLPATQKPEHAKIGSPHPPNSPLSKRAGSLSPTRSSSTNHPSPDGGNTRPRADDNHSHLLQTRHEEPNLRTTRARTRKQAATSGTSSSH